MLELRLFIVGLSLLHVVCSINLELLSILEYSLTGRESTKCDLAVFGQDMAMDVEHELQRPMIFSSRGNRDAEYKIRRSLIILSNCLILIMGEEVSIKEMKNLAEKTMNIKPTGVVYEVKNKYRMLAEDAGDLNWPFPVIFKKVNGKFH